jgi:transposase
MEQNQAQAQGREHIWQWFGLDVSKDSFTAAFHSVLLDGAKPEVPTFESNRKGVRNFLRWRKSQLAAEMPSGIVMESTGYHSRDLAGLLLREDSSLHVSICNARSVSYYIKSHVPHKTDKSDAVLIAKYGYDSQPPRMKARSREEKLLKELVSERMKLVNIKTMLSNKNNSLEFKDARAINKDVLDCLEKKIRELDRKIVEVGSQSVEMNEEIELMATIPGIGRLSASVIHAELGSLRQYTRRQLSAMSGLYPRIIQSGTSLKKSKLAKAGSAYLRQILYLDATQAMKNIPALAALRERLLARDNTSKMTARCACMRKLLLIAKGVVDSGIPYDPNFQQKKQEISSKPA